MTSRRPLWGPPCPDCSISTVVFDYVDRKEFVCTVCKAIVKVAIRLPDGRWLVQPDVKQRFKYE